MTKRTPIWGTDMSTYDMPGYREHRFDHETIPPDVDMLQFCDEDIQEAFKDTTYVVTAPLMVQLAREIRKLREAIEAQ